MRVFALLVLCVLFSVSLSAQEPPKVTKVDPALTATLNQARALLQRTQDAMLATPEYKALTQTDAFKAFGESRKLVEALQALTLKVEKP